MINSSFKYWEISIVTVGLILSTIIGVIASFSGFDFIFMWIPLASIALFVRPLWLIFNGRNLKLREHIKVHIVGTETRGVGKYSHQVVTVKYTDNMGKDYTQKFNKPLFMNDESNEYTAAFDPKRPKILIFEDNAIRSAKIAGGLGIIAVAVSIVYWLFKLII